MSRTAKTNRGSGPGRIFYTIIAAVVVAGVAGLILARSDDQGPLEIPLAIAETEPDAEAGVSAGPEDSPVTLVEFADFQCPACARFYAFSGRLIKQNYVDGGGQVRWVFYDFPLEQHPHALPAALAARCAGEQGGFWPMHDLIFARQSQWSVKQNPRDDFDDFAGEIGLDRGEFGACMSEGRYLEPIFASAKYGERLGVTSTPTLFVNGRRAPQDYEGLETMILEAAAAAAAGESGGDDGEAAGDAPEAAAGGEG